MIENRNPGLNRKSKRGCKGETWQRHVVYFPNYGCSILTDLRASNFDPL